MSRAGSNFGNHVGEHGVKTINTVVGIAAVALDPAPVECSEIILRAHPDNTDNIYYGYHIGVGVGDGMVLQPGETVTKVLSHTKQLFLVADAAAQNARTDVTT